MNDIPNDPAIEATESQRPLAENMPRTSRRHSEHRNHGTGRRKSQRLMLAIALGITLLLLILVSIFSIARIDSLTTENNSMHAELFQAKQALQKADPELQRARKDLANLIKGQLPHLREFLPDRVLDVNAAYVKNVVFTVLHKNGETRYEYRVVMENTSETTAHPDARIFLFDQRGIQVGMSEIADHADLGPGESRAYSSVAERFIDEEPRYFYVWTRPKRKS